MTTGREKHQCPFVRGLKKMELHKVTKLVSGRTGIQARHLVLGPVMLFVLQT